MTEIIGIRALSQRVLVVAVKGTCNDSKKQAERIASDHMKKRKR